MAMKLEASVNILWQNLIALNASLMKENEEKRMELLDTKLQLKKETQNSKDLLAANKKQQLELFKQNTTIAKMSSKMVAVKQIDSYFPDPDDDVSEASTLPVIVKVESVESDMDTLPYLNTFSDMDTLPATDDEKWSPLPVNVCGECDKKFRSPSTLKSHMLLHNDPKFSCPNCPQKFARSDYLTRHVKRAHKNRSMSMRSSRSTRRAN